MIYGDDDAETDWQAVCEAMILYADNHIKQGGRLIHVSRHMVGLFHGKPQSRRYRQILSTDAVRSDDAADVFQRAFDAVLTPAIAAE